MGDLRIIVISETVQEFRGERFYKCGKYFQRDGKRLHVTVWEAANGRRPQGFHIHHIDHDRSNNQLSNLEAVPRAEHGRHHMEGRAEQSRELCNRIRPLAAAWHGSEAGKAWHRVHYDEVRDKLHARTQKTCIHCGKGFEGLANNRFCSNNCKSAWRRAEGLDNVTRQCESCGSDFTVNKYWPNKTCSRSCGTTLQHRERRASRESGCVLSERA